MAALVNATGSDDAKQLRQQAIELQTEVERLRQELAVVQAGLGLQAASAEDWQARRPVLDSVGLTAGEVLSNGLKSTGTNLFPSLASLLQSNDRLHAIVESAVDYAIITADLQDRITGWSSGATRLLGWEEAEVLGRPCKLIFTPEDCAAGVPEAEMRRALSKGKAVDERWHIRRDGTLFWAVGELMPLHDHVLLGYLKILRDRTEQRRSEDALRESEQRYRLIVESARDYAIFTTDLQGRITSWNRGAREVLGWSEAEAVGRPNTILYTPEDHMAGIAEAEMAQSVAEGRAEQDRWHLRSDGTRIWGTEVMTPLQDSDGKAHGFLKILRDRTDQKREEEQRKLLLAELNHRAKNTLATVQALLAQTASGAATPAALQEALEGRLNALAVAHDLLTREVWTGAWLADVVRVNLAPYSANADRLRVNGPDLRLTPNAALVLSMALNELATNAAKQGALSNDQGRLDITWSLECQTEAPGHCMLDMLWREQGGPPVVSSPQRGHGSRLIEDSVSYQLGGNVSLQFLPEGVECRFKVPMAKHTVSAR